MRGYYTEYSYVEVLDDGTKKYYVSDDECKEMHEEERNEQDEEN